VSGLFFYSTTLSKHQLGARLYLANEDQLGASLYLANEDQLGASLYLANEPFQWALFLSVLNNFILFCLIKGVSQTETIVLWLLSCHNVT